RPSSRRTGGVMIVLSVLPAPRSAPGSPRPPRDHSLCGLESLAPRPPRETRSWSLANTSIVPVMHDETAQERGSRGDRGGRLVEGGWGAPEENAGSLPAEGAKTDG